MGAGDETARRRVLVPHALGADEFLRVTWHPGRQVVVFSHWQGDTCVAATPVRVDDIGEVAELLTSATDANALDDTSGPERAEHAEPLDRRSA